MNISYRLIRADEHGFLREMLYEALFVPPGQSPLPISILESPDIKKYIKNWGDRAFDLSIVAVGDQELLGAIWGRMFGPEEKGYGFVNEKTPEISMAIREGFRNKGIGTELLTRIEIEYAILGIEALSLSVDKLNPAKNLYGRLGYELVEEAGTAITLMKQISKE